MTIHSIVISGFQLEVLAKVFLNGEVVEDDFYEGIFTVVCNCDLERLMCKDFQGKRILVIRDEDIRKALQNV